MPLIDEFKQICDRLDSLGWRDLLLAVSGGALDIRQPSAAALKSVLATELSSIDRQLPGFEDFALEGGRGIEPGQPARSLLLHALGWEWRAPLGPSRCAWARLRLLSTSAPEPRGDLAAPSALPPSSDAGIDLSWRLIPACAGPGYFLLGDAAATLDPSSSHGVLRALMSGILAGHLLAVLGCGRAGASEVMAAFRDWTHGQFTHDTAALRALWQRHPCEATRARMATSAPTRDASFASVLS
ncbi:MAG: hypothetical protein M3463_07250 [Verrucomicrobiota bacterium]|nr:hypothetical protein [Verrucomicrobiota bacterium]